MRLITRGRHRLDEALWRCWPHAFSSAAGARRRSSTARSSCSTRAAFPASRALQEALAAGAGEQLRFYAFDLMYLDGYDLSKVTLVERKALLAATARRPGSASSAIQFSDHVEGDGAGALRPGDRDGARGHRLASAPTRPTSRAARKSWVKAKALQTGDFVIAGYTLSTAAAGLGGAGARRVGRRRTANIAARSAPVSMRPSMTATPRRLEPLRGAGRRSSTGMPKDVIWVRPVLTAHIHYANLTADNSLRHAVFKGLREAEIEPSRGAGQAQAADLGRRPRQHLGDQPDAPAVRQDRADQARHRGLLRAVGDFMLPHIFGRPVSLVRCPSGAARRHASSSATPSPACRPRSRASRRMSSEEERARSYISVEDAKGYLALAQFGVVEFHAWGCTGRTARKAGPGDLRPRPRRGHRVGARWSRRRFTSRRCSERLGLVPFVKTSGGKGAARRGAAEAEARLEEDCMRQPARSPAADRRGGARDLRSTWPRTSASKRIFIDFHRNCARRHGRRRPISLRARSQPAGLDAAQLGRSAFGRRAGGPQLFFAARAVDGAWRSLGGDG